MALLAFKMSMPKGTFNNKLSEKHHSKFSDTERMRLIGILRELLADLDFITGIDFNDALSIIVSKK
jgi:hypothetical protein